MYGISNSNNTDRIVISEIKRNKVRMFKIADLFNRIDTHVFDHLYGFLLNIIEKNATYIDTNNSGSYACKNNGILIRKYDDLVMDYAIVAEFLKYELEDRIEGDTYYFQNSKLLVDIAYLLFLFPCNKLENFLGTIDISPYYSNNSEMYKTQAYKYYISHPGIGCSEIVRIFMDLHKCKNEEDLKRIIDRK